ncbi:XRE family transcriptional regulator [Kribbella albertanoniae]|uniref:XRE family transcriptional regulator n=2 Tax=Kribbella albertanoniae TaxID=1266829 RepID=A0A4R4P706_9ACTN|nr:XRE family transcriptional regulator [Kribbella albertanoniae]
MDNRGLSPRAVSRASARAESTILQLLDGRIMPSPEIVRDIAPALQIAEADLLTIAGLATTARATSARPYRNSTEIGELVSIASSLSDGQLEQLVGIARRLKSEDHD